MIKKFKDKYHNSIAIKFKTYKQFKEFMISYNHKKKSKIISKEMNDLLDLK